MNPVRSFITGDDKCKEDKMMRKRETSSKAGTSNGVKVLLCEDVKSLGWLGDIVEVATGYARNYLLPKGLAIVPTEGNLRSLAEEKARRAEQRKLASERAETLAAAVEGAEAVIAAKVNEQGVLFGSVGPREIAANLREQGFEVADDVVALAENIKQVGTHSVRLRFDKDLTATVNVVVVAEQEDENEPDDQDK
jgi:large subunit ribosomal protein L9